MTRRFLPFLALELSATSGCLVSPADESLAYDRDHDGWQAVEVGGQDCDDGAASVYPGAAESCLDEVDSDCDGLSCPERIDSLLTADDVWAWGEEGASLGGEVDLADFDGDGNSELLVTEPGAAGGQGRVLAVLLPRPEPLDPAADALGAFTAEGAGGLRASSAGDLDGDGDDEVAISATGGAATVWLVDELVGETTTAEAASWLTVADDQPADSTSEEPPGPSESEVRFGRVHSLGDRDGTGAGVWLLSSPGYSAAEERRGAVFLLAGLPAAGVEAPDAAVATIHGSAAEDALGLSEADSCPDLDGDGRPDAFLEAVGYRPEELGADGGPDVSTGGLFGFIGDPRGDLAVADADLRIVSLLGNSTLGRGGRVGDVDADGYDDVGAFFGAGAGEFLVFLGPVSGVLYPNDAQVRLVGGIGETLTSAFGDHWAGEVDADGDHRDDVLVSATLEGTAGLGDGPDQSGATYLFLGPLSGVQNPDHARMRWVGAFEGGQQGLALAHDLAGRGELDLLLGAELAQPGDEPPAREGSRGALFLVPGAFAAL